MGRSIHAENMYISAKPYSYSQKLLQFQHKANFNDTFCGKMQWNVQIKLQLQLLHYACFYKLTLTAWLWGEFDSNEVANSHLSWQQHLYLGSALSVVFAIINRFEKKQNIFFQWTQVNWHTGETCLKLDGCDTVLVFSRSALKAATH